MENFAIHVCYLLFHFSDFFFFGSDVSFEFFDFVIKDKLEFFQFLGFFLQLINTSALVFDSLFPFVDFFGMRFFFLLEHFVGFLNGGDFFHGSFQLAFLIFEFLRFRVVVVSFFHFLDFALFERTKQLLHPHFVQLFQLVDLFFRTQLQLVQHLFEVYL